MRGWIGLAVGILIGAAGSAAAVQLAPMGRFSGALYSLDWRSDCSPARYGLGLDQQEYERLIACIRQRAETDAPWAEAQVYQSAIDEIEEARAERLRWAALTD